MNKIVKYSNRKLYSLTTNKYLKLKDILDLVSKGEHIEIVDRISDKSSAGPFEDITIDVVTKAFFKAGLFHSTVKDFLALRRIPEGIPDER
jgi:polyhydroxyalkanoate synthesis regulator protein